MYHCGNEELSNGTSGRPSEIDLCSPAHTDVEKEGEGKMSNEELRGCWSKENVLQTKGESYQYNSGGNIRRRTIGGKYCNCSRQTGGFQGNSGYSGFPIGH